MEIRRNNNEKKAKYVLIFAVLTLLCAVFVQPIVALAQNLDSSGVVDRIELSKKNLNDGEHVKFTVSFSEKENASIESGDTIELELPRSEKGYIQGFNKTFDLKDDAGTVLGQVCVREEKVTITFNDKASSLDHVRGTFYFTAEARNVEQTTEGSTITFDTNFGIPTLDKQKIEITRGPSVSGTYPPFYKVGTMYPNDTEHVQWWLNFNLDHRMMTEDGYIEDQVMPGHDMDWSTFEITLNQKSPSLSKEEFIAQGYGDIEYIDGNPEHYYIRLDKDKLKDTSVVISYKTKITEPEQDSFENKSKVWYRFENGEHGSAEENNSTVQNVFAGGGAQGDPTQKEVKIIKENQRQQALKGAKLQLTDTTEDKVISTWESKSSAQSIILSKGHYYTLEELEAPEGYEKAEPITFRVTAYGLVEVKQADGSYKKVSQATIKMIDKPKVKTLDLRKVGSDQPETLLEGAQIQLKNLTTNEIVETFKTTKDPHTLSVNYGDMYMLSELDAPEGYDVADHIIFQVKQDGSILIKGKDGQFTPLRGQTIMMVDGKKAPEKTLVMVRKLSQNKVTPVKGAKLKLVDAESNKEIASFTSGTDAYKISLENGKKYRLIEEEAPRGYLIADPIDFEINKQGEVLIDGKVCTDNTLKMYDLRKEATYPFKKLDEANHYVKGAKLILKNRSTHLIEKEWVSDDKEESLTLKVGQIYEIVEEEAPEGYKEADPIILLVKSDGTLLVNGKESQEKTLEMIDQRLKTEVAFAKKDSETKAFLPGAKFTLTNKTLNQTDSFTSETKEIVQSLPNDCYYRLEETEAPKGYEPIDPIDFVVRSDGRVQVKQGDDYINVSQQWIDIYNHRKKQTVTFEKRDGQSHLLLSGATLKLTDVTTQETVMEWQTTLEAKQIALTYGHRYQLEEVTAPTGYLIADPITFEVTMDGSIRYNEQLLDTHTITMNDYRLGAPLKFKKVDDQGNVVKGAKMALYNTSDHLSHEEFTTTDEPKTLNLKRKQSYVLKELEAPEGYQLADDITIMVLDNGKILVDGKEYQKDTLTMVDLRLTSPVSLEKQDAETQQPLENAQLKVIDEEGKEVASWTSTKEAKSLTLEYGKTYQWIEIKAPEGYDIAEPITFRLTTKGVLEIKENGEFKSADRIIMKDQHRQRTVMIDKQSFDSHRRLKNAKLQLVDQTTQKVVMTWQTTATPKEVPLVYGHRYQLKELEAPAGYLIADPINFEVLMDGQIRLENHDILKEDTVVMFDKRRGVPLSFEKNDELGQRVSGATIDIIDSDTKEVVQTIKEGKATLNLKTGHRYEAVEVETPQGYTTAKPISIEVSNDGSIKVNGEAYQKDTIYMIDYHQKVPIQFNKKDEQTKETLEGATLVLKDLSTGKELSTFVSTKEAKELSLYWGHRYQLEEIKAPLYYQKLDQPLIFDIDKEGHVVIDETSTNHNEVVINNQRQTKEVEIHKYMTQTQIAVEKAELELYDGDQLVVKHVTRDQPWRLTLEYGKTYRLKEAKAPAGFAVAQDILFKIDEQGHLWQKSEGEEQYRQVEAITMEDTPLVHVLKTDRETGLPLPGAQLQIIDAKTKEELSPVWQSGNTPVLASGLTPNRDYYLIEKQAPKGYRLAKALHFKIDEQWNVFIEQDGQWLQSSARLITLQNEKEVMPKPEPDDEIPTPDENNSNPDKEHPDPEGENQGQGEQNVVWLPLLIINQGKPVYIERPVDKASSTTAYKDLPQTGNQTHPMVNILGLMMIGLSALATSYVWRKEKS